ncbi:DUF1330 domain-containing protein [Candidatus Accumulibacter sp. ACC003]|uniref:DUF1330 domain-containing protein n=1 Tax=Candidatus Accumulibacter sp. ACC003 TaxID=2823334 RepID=UPI0025BDA30B|nr:DUF1330 domain-containing protein [Candidatus Accumulibacter sp. ACC003]
MAKQVFDGDDLNAGAMAELAALPDGQPFALINLLLYKEWAEYPPGTVSEKLTGKQAYERYTELVVPLVNEVGGVPMWRGSLAVNLIGPDDERWDEVLIMQYPSRGAFQRMLANPDYQATVLHRTAAVSDSRLYGATSPEAIGPMKWKLFNLTRKLRGD